MAKDKWTDKNPFKTFEDIINDTSKEFGVTPYKATFSNDKVWFDDFTNTPSGSWKITRNRQNNIWDLNTQPGQQKVAGDAIEKEETQSPTVKLHASSTIQSASYWPDKEYLVVSFKSGSTYSYKNVPIDIVSSWEGASSAGSYFYYNIRTSFSYQKMG